MVNLLMYVPSEESLAKERVREATGFVLPFRNLGRDQGVIVDKTVSDLICSICSSPSERPLYSIYHL
jgi:hypothetical protein